MMETFYCNCISCGGGVSFPAHLHKVTKCLCSHRFHTSPSIGRTAAWFSAHTPMMPLKWTCSISWMMMAMRSRKLSLTKMLSLVRSGITDMNRDLMILWPVCIWLFTCNVQHACVIPVLLTTHPSQRMESGPFVTNPAGRTLRRSCTRTLPSTSSSRGSLFSTSSTLLSPASSLVFWLYLSSTFHLEQVSSAAIPLIAFLNKSIFQKNFL